MSCARLVEVEAARDGRDPRRAGLDGHVRGCAVCRARIEELEELALALRALPLAPADELAARRRRGELLARHATEARPRRLLVGLATAAALGLVAVVSYVTTRTPTTRIPDAIEIRADHATWSRLDAGDTTIVRLDEGEAELHVSHGARRLVVLVPDGEVDDIGTTFRVTVHDRHTTRIAVDEGAIIFRQVDRLAIALVRGDRWSAHVAAPTTSIAASTLVTAPPPTRNVPRPDLLGAAIARIDAGDAAGAATALRHFLVEHPRDARGEDAEYLLIVALQRVPDPEGVRAAARDYLRNFPSGLRRTAVESLAR